MTKRCSGCKETKAKSEFYRNRTKSDGLSNECKICSRWRAQENYRINAVKIKTQIKDWQKQNRDKVAVYRRRQRFNELGLDQEAYDEMLARQGHCCAICQQDFNGGTPNIDHCHTSGAVRGLLCGSCNKGLGHFRDNSGTLARAITYLGTEA